MRSMELSCRALILGQGHRDAAGDKLGLGLGKPAANLGLPELGELESDGIDGVDLVSQDPRRRRQTPER